MKISRLRALRLLFLFPLLFLPRVLSGEVVTDLRHGHVFDKPNVVELFIRQHLEGGTPLARIAEPEINAAQVKAKVESAVKLIKAELHYTLDPTPGDAKSRVWTTVPAEIADDTILAQLPPEKTTVWFLNVTDERQATTSSRLMIAGER